MPPSDPPAAASDEGARPGEPGGKGPDFGPGGYLPERAAKRARKIVLREEMGLQWPIAAAVAAVVVLIAGALFLATGAGPPAEPFQPLARIDDVDPRGATFLPAGTAGEGLAAPVADVLVVRAGGGVRTFQAPDGAHWCPASERVEAPDGRVWNPAGRLVGGEGASLRALPSQVYDGMLYVDETAPAPPVPADDRGEEPTCS